MVDMLVAAKFTLGQQGAAYWQGQQAQGYPYGASGYNQYAAPAAGFSVAIQSGAYPGGYPGAQYAGYGQPSARLQYGGQPSDGFGTGSPYPSQPQMYPVTAYTAQQPQGVNAAHRGPEYTTQQAAEEDYGAFAEAPTFTPASFALAPESSTRSSPIAVPEPDWSQPLDAKVFAMTSDTPTTTETQAAPSVALTDEQLAGQVFKRGDAVW
jgi:hypothetical protein